ncbi:hypothetical protein D3C81_1756930 [compost metagenome]
MIEQIGQRPRCRVHTVGQAQLRPVIGQGAVQAQHATLIQQLRQQAHVGLGLRSDVHRRGHRQRRATVGIARATHIAQQLPLAINHNDCVARPQRGDAIQKHTQLLRGLLRGCGARGRDDRNAGQHHQ